MSVMKRYYVMFYHVVSDFLKRRGEFRKAHLQKVFEAHRRGELIYGGAMGDPADRTMLVFRSDNKVAAETFAKNDPYVINGLVERWEIEPWMVVCGLREGDFDPLEGQPQLRAAA